MTCLIKRGCWLRFWRKKGNSFGFVSPCVSIMDVPTLLHNLKEEVTCSVCIHLYTNPKQLPCLHIFCLECLNDLARTSTRHGKIKCPICETEVAVPESGTMETLPSCFYVKNLLDVLSIKECNTSNVTCGNCDEKRDQASYCFHCGKFWCKDCLNAHNILKENREHRVLSLKDFQDKDIQDVLKRPVFCQRELHNNEVLKFYCKLCEVPVCQTCVIVDHNKHDVEHLEISARAVKNNMATKLDAAKESTKVISSNIRHLEETSRLLKNRSEIRKGQIKQTVESLILILRQREHESLAQEEEEAKKAQVELMKEKDKFQDHLNEREQSISQIECLVERNTGAELVRNKEFIDEQLNGLQQSQQMVTAATTERKLPKTVFLQNQEIFQFLQESRIGHLEESATEANQCTVEGFQTAAVGLETEFQVITRNNRGEQNYCPGDYIAVNVTSTRGVLAPTQITDCNNGSYKVLFIPREAGQHGAIIQVNGESIPEIPLDIKEWSFRPLRVTLQRNIDRKSLKCPWGMTVSESNEIFVTDKSNNRIVVFNEKGEFVKSFGEGLLYKPTGICTDQENRIYVANRGNNKVLLFNSRGEYIMDIHNGKTLKEPRGIALDAQGNLIVCDTENKCVQFISAEGIIFKTVGRGRLHKPFGCLCYDNKVFVSDANANLIKVYSSNGRFLYEFGVYGTGDGKLNEPAGLAVDKMGHLLICSGHNHRMQVFTLDGKFVTKFGKRGSELGEFREPNAVCVLKNGIIVVCEFGNNRLQFFSS